MKVYGIPACTTVKKARAWLDRHGVDYTFVDFKKTPPERSQVKRWVDTLGWEQVLNRRGTTWRTLDPHEQARIKDANGAIDAMLARPTVIKRPVIETDDGLLIGFDEPEYAQRLRRGRPARAT